METTDRKGREGYTQVYILQSQGPYAQNLPKNLKYPHPTPEFSATVNYETVWSSFLDNITFELLNLNQDQDLNVF